MSKQQSICRILPSGLHVGFGLTLVDRFFLYYGQGTLSVHKRQLMEGPYYDQMIDALWDHNYRPWIKEMIETTKYSGGMLEISW